MGEQTVRDRVYEDGIPLTENARKVLERRYLRKGLDGKPIETIAEMFHRVARAIAAVEPQYGGDAVEMERKFYALLTTLRFLPNSPTFTGAGTPLGQLAACFVLPIADDMGKRPDGIFSTLRAAALIQQTGGGNGFSFSRLRPRGEHVVTSAGQATGPVGFLRVYDKAFGEIAQGGCLLPDTLVFTDQGLLRLDEIVDAGKPGWQPHALRVATDEGWRSSPRGYNNGVASVLRVHTREGLSLTGTPEHRVKVMTDTGPEWRQLQELRPGDWLLVRLGEHRGRLQALRHPRPRHGNSVWPKLPRILDEELAFFLGYLAGDGFIAAGDNDHRIGVSVAHTSYLMEEMPTLMRRLFGVNVRRQQKPDDRSVTFVIDNRAVKEFLLLNGFEKPDSRSVCVPRLIRQSPPEIVGAYLRGLFEADGSLSHGYPTLVTTSKRLAKEVATLLIGLGCPVRMRTIAPGVDRWGDSETYQIRIHSTVGLQAWRERIGCDIRSRFVAAYAWEGDQQREISYVLPCPRYWVEPVLKAIPLEQVDAKGRGRGLQFRSTAPRLRRALLRYLRGDRKLTRSGYDELCRKFPEFAAHARSPEGLWFVQVTGVEPAGEALTLDLEVDGNHTYLAYGFVTHNTRRGANMAVLRIDHPDIREFIRCKAQEGEITNFNISVAITDDFMRAVENDGMWELRFPDVEDPRYREFHGTINQAEKAGIPIKVYDRVRARELFDEIVKHAHHNGEPGVLFIDAANRDNPVPHLYELEATNPCVTGDTLVATPTGWRRVDQIRVGDEILTVSGVGRVAEIEINFHIPVYLVQFSDGGSIRVTASHQFYVRDPQTGTFHPRRLDALRVGDEVQVLRPMSMPVKEAALAVYDSLIETSSMAEGSDHLPELDAAEGTAYVLSITPAGIETVYDLYEPETDTWITAGYVSRGCGEQWLGPYENCCLGSINLAHHVEDGRIDWEKLRETIETATRFLDNVVTANKYVPAVPQLKEAAEKCRRIGLGIMGLADVMYHLGVRYGSPEGEELASQIMEFVRFHAMKTSIALARERGPFPAIKGSIYDPEDIKWKPPTPLRPYERDFGRPPIDWNEVVEGIKQHGIRNAAQTTIAPTGCLVAGSMVVTDQGILPIEALGDPHGSQWQDVRFQVASEGGLRWATKFYVNGVAHTIKVRTRRGYVIQATDGHKIRVWERDRLVWKRMDEIRPGMQLPLVGTGLIGTPRSVRLDNRLVTDFHATPVTLPEKMTPLLAYLVGFFMGDGSLKTRSLRFSISSPALLQHVIDIVRQVFDVEPKVLEDPRANGLVSLEIHSRNIVEFWQRNGFAKRTPSPEHKGKGYVPHLPFAVLQTNDPDVYAAFLAGLFDADGTVHGGYHLVWCTTNSQFHDQVKAILLALGVLTTTDYQTTGMGHSRAYRLRTAHGDAASRLWKLLAPYSHREAPGVNVRRRSLGDTVPLTEPEYRMALRLATTPTETYRLWGWHQRGFLASRASLDRFVQEHREEMQEQDLERLVRIIEDEVYFDEVVEIEDGGWVETYDLSVPGSHAYVAQGFVSHNTIATVAGCEGYGCEPVFALAYIRHVQDGDRVLDLQYTSPLFEKALIEAGIDEETRQAIYEEVMRTGTCQHIEAVPEPIRHTFVVASDITPEEHVRMQAALQRFVDNSISKCVVGDTLLLTPNGLIPIQELAEAPLPDQFVPLAMRIVSPEGVETTDAFYYGGYRETRKVALQYGFEIEGTPNHRIHVLDAGGNVVFRRLDELKPGDMVVLYAGQQCFGPSGAELPAFSGAFRTSSKAVRFPEHMSTDLAFLLGCIASAGAITANGINIANSDVALLEELQRLVMQLFGIESHIGKDPRNDIHYLQVNSRALRHWLLSDLGLQSGAENKIIPTCILQAAREEIGAFLRGLFLDGYVTRDGKRFGITLASRRLIQQLQVLLLNFGILATVRQMGERAWNLTVQGRELDRLAEAVGFREAWKNERLARRHEGRVFRLRNYSRLLPRSGTSALREMQLSSGASLRSHYFLCESGVRNAYADHFFANDDQHKLYLEVQSVTTGYAEVFDISVPGSHSFIANGLGNHNTINFPASATVDDVARAYFQAWKLGCKGLTVYVTGTREKVVLETKATLEAKQRKEKMPEKMAEPNGSFIKKPRPRKLHGYTYKQATPLGNAYITVTEDEEGHPFEVFLNVGKGGSDTSAAAEAIGRLISLVLRLPSERSPEERLQEIVDELTGIGGGRRLGFGSERVSSLPDGVAKALAEYLGLPEAQAPLTHVPTENGDQVRFDADFCPECGNATLVREEGCRKCYSCGYSEC